MRISAQLKRAAEALIKRDMRRFMENMLKADLAAQEGKGEEGQERDNKVLVGGARV